MNASVERVISSLRAGKVTTTVGHGNSMLPVIRSGQTQVLVPVLSQETAEQLQAPPYDGRQEPGALGYLRPEDLREGDAVFCRVKGNVFTHEIVAIEEGPVFLIGPHHRRHLNGRTRAVYGKCVKVL